MRGEGVSSVEIRRNGLICLKRVLPVDGAAGRPVLNFDLLQRTDPEKIHQRLCCHIRKCVIKWSLLDQHEVLLRESCTVSLPKCKQ